MKPSAKSDRNADVASADPLPSQVVERWNFVVAAFLLFASGISALIYQILWVRQLSLVVGVDVHAVSVVISGFFAGLALGGWLFGRWIDQVRQPAKLYVLIEFGTGLLGVGCTIFLAKMAPLFATLEGVVGPLAWLLPLLVVGAPATLMGGTLPVLVRALITTHRGPISSLCGTLYAANTAGAIAGALLTSFVLIPSFGVLNTAFLSAGLNVLAGLGALALRNSDNTSTSGPAVKRSAATRLALALYAVAGGIALGYEVVWSQIVVQWTSTRSFAFAVVLAVYLAGLMLGSFLYSRWSDRTRDPWGQFGLLITATGLSALLQTILLGDWLSRWQVVAATQAFHATGQESLAMAARFAVAATCVMLIPTILLGAAFPAAVRLTGEATSAGRDAGGVLAVNTIGGIAGSLITGFLLIPMLGPERGLAVLTIAASVLGVIAVLWGTTAQSPLRWVTLACGLATVAATFAVDSNHLSQLLATRRKGTLRFHESGAGGTVAVIEQVAGATPFRRLYIQGVSNSGDSMTSLRYMRLQSLLPLLIHREEPRSAIVIGLGTGITAGSLLAYDGLERRVCAELLPQVVEASSLFAGNFDVAKDARVEIRLRDGRRELLRRAESYDLITLEPPPPSATGVANLYSRDFYQLAASRLQPNGLLAQWLPLPTQTEEDTRSLVRSFLDVFPHATLWTTEIHETLLIGSLSPIELDVARIATRFQQPKVASALDEVGIRTPAALLATYLTDTAGLERYASHSLPVTDDRPRIEYGPWTLPGQFQRTLAEILELQTEPPLTNASLEFRAAVQEQRQILQTFYAATTSASQGDRTKWRQSLSWVLNKDSDNPYYRWFATGNASGRPQ